MPFLHGTEINWQARENGCAIHLKITDDSITLLQPLFIQAILEYPNTYRINERSLIDHLNQHVNILQPRLRIDSIKSSLDEASVKRTHQFDFQLHFISTGNFLISFLNVEFISLSANEGNVVIYTPIIAVEVTGSKDVEDIAIAPLISLEPKLPLSITNENKQFLFNAKRLALEEARNVRILGDHSLPWRTLSGLTLFFVLGYMLIKYRNNLFRSPFQKTQSQFLKKRTEDHLSILRSELDRHGNVSEIYFKISSLFRMYLEENFKKKISIFSENEIEDLVNSFSMPLETQKLVNSFLKETFFMKFSDRQPTLYQCQNAFIVLEKTINLNFVDLNQQKS